MTTTWAATSLSALKDQSSLAILIGTILAVLLTTRFFTGVNGASKVTIDGNKTAPIVPYWVPFLGHVPQLSTGSDGFLRRLRQSYPGGVFSLRVFGTTHSIVHEPSLANALLSKPDSEASSTAMRLQLLKNVFGLPTKDTEKFERAIPQLAHNEENLIAESEGENMVLRTVDLLRHNIADFVTFNNSQVDQSPWETFASSLVDENFDGEPVVEADLLDLVRNYVAITASPSLLGSDFVTNFPEFWSSFWDFEDGYLLMALKWPRWIPSAKLNRARGALNNLLRIMRNFEDAMEKQWRGEDPGSTWQDLDDVGAVIRARMDIYREHNISIQARAASDLALIRDTYSNAALLGYWMLCHIYQNTDLTTRLRKEIAPFVEIFEPSGEFGPAISEPVRLKRIDSQSVLARCPLLMATYIETLRLYDTTLSSRYMNEDVALTDDDNPGVILHKGSYAHIAEDLQRTDPATYEEPTKWLVNRHLSTEHLANAKTGKVKLSTSQDYRRPELEAISRIAYEEVRIFIAAILMVWDIRPAGNKSWKQPDGIRHIGTRKPANRTRVWIKQRR